MNRDHQKNEVPDLMKALKESLGESDACSYTDHGNCPIPTMCGCSCHKAKVGDSTPPATEAEALVRGLEDVRAGRIVPLPPVERKPTTLELSGTMPDVSHYSRCARCGGSGREEDASHPPAVSGEGERLTEQAAAYRAIALDALACWQGEDDRSDDNQRRNRSARSRATLRHRICAVDDTVRASTPTPGAPR